MDGDHRIRKEKSTIRYLVTEKIRELISDAHFKPGDRLIERELCEMFDVGRTSIREAMRQLEAEGLIQSEPHKGPVVTKITQAEVQQLFEIRALLEGFCGTEFAKRGTEAEHAAFKAAVEAFAATDPKQDGTRLLAERKAELYRIMIQGARNIYVETMLTGLHNRITLLRRRTMNQPNRLTQSIAEIREISSAILARDAQRARAACIFHIEESAKVALRVMQDET